MDREGNSSTSQVENILGTGAVEASPNSDPQSRITTNPSAGTNERKMREIKPEVWIAIITSITGIMIALFSFPPFIALFQKEETPVAVETSMTLFFTSTPASLFMDTPGVTFTETASLTPSPTNTTAATAIPSETVTLPPQPILIVRLVANKTSGKAPLAVKLDARASYMTELDGQTYVCRNGPCFYTWKVYSNGQQIGKSVTGSGGTFDYRFGKKGIYTITVWVCRGRDGVDCGGSGVQIVVS